MALPLLEYDYRELSYLFPGADQDHLRIFKTWLDSIVLHGRATDVTINWIIENISDLVDLDIPPRFVRFEYTVTAAEAPLQVYTLEQAYVASKIIVFMNARVLEPSDYVEQEDEDGNRTQIRFLMPPRENNIIHGIYIPVS